METLTTFLLKQLSQQRQERMVTVLEQRTRYLTVVLEDIYQAQNASAVLRHCDALGIQEIHVIENNNRCQIDDNVALGTAQWLDIYKHRDQEGNNTSQVLKDLKARGYRIVATVPQARKNFSPETLNLCSGPAALVLGTEKDGISEHVYTQADEFLTIPMVGFVDSFNLSASAAIILYILSRRLKGSSLSWQLDEEDKKKTTLRWLRKTLPRARELEEEFYRRGRVSQENH